MLQVETTSGICQCFCMSKPILISLLLMVPGQSLAQEGFEADLMQPCLAGPGLAHACYPGAQGNGLVFATSVNWAHHLLKLHDDENDTPGTWLVEDRVTVSTAMGFRYESGFRFSIGLDWIARQQGQQTDGVGAPMDMATGMGKSWIQSSVDLLRHPNINVSMETGLVFPSPNPSILAAPGRVRWKMGLRASLNFWLLHPLLAVGVRFGENQNFSDITRDNSIYWDTAIEVTKSSWMWGVFVEAFGITRMSTPFSSRANDYSEALAGARIRLLDDLEIVVGASMGIRGPGAPLIRPMAVFRIFPEKITLENE